LEEFYVNVADQTLATDRHNGLIHSEFSGLSFGDEQ